MYGLFRKCPGVRTPGFRTLLGAKADANRREYFNISIY